MDFPFQFIKAGEEYSTPQNYVPAPYFRKTFFAEKKLLEASLIITGIGFYEVYLNGENITKGYLAPYRSNPDHYIYYDKYDLTFLLKRGKNVLGVILGNGMRNSLGGYIWDFDKARFRGAPITAFSLEMKFDDGTEETVLSDTETLTAPSPVLFDDLHFGEYYDARLEIPGWSLPEYDDSGWKNALPAEPPRGEAKLCEAEPIVLRNTIKPVSVTAFEDGFVYDFGVNSAGLCKLKINGENGQKIILRYFETLVDGKPHLSNIRFYDSDRYQEDEYTCSGNGTEEYTPRFTYHGFRYVWVSGITAVQATKELLTYLELSSDISVAGEFSCNDEVINKIQEMTLRSDISNFYYFPTDCPQREKNGWTADASLSAEQMLLNLTPEKSYKEWLRNIYKAIRDNGQLPGIIPTGGWGYHWGNGPAWDNVIVYLPYYTYIYRGDKEILKELSAPLMRYLNYLFTRLDENGLMEIGLGDWCQPSRECEAFDTPLIVTDSILTVDIAEKAAFIYEVLNEEPQRQFALSLAERVKYAFREKLIDKKTLEVAGKTQTAQAMALYYGLFTEEEKPRALDILISYIEKAGGHFDTGVLGGRVIYRLLADNGYEELAYNMIVREDYPSYGNWAARGATTLWEVFMPEGGPLHSLNHHFWGDVSAWFYIYLAGIRVNPTGRDTANIDIKPLFIERLSSVSAYYNTPHGKITVDIKHASDGAVLNITASEKLHGVIAAPKGYRFFDGVTEKPLVTGKYRMVKS